MERIIQLINSMDNAAASAFDPLVVIKAVNEISNKEPENVFEVLHTYCSLAREEPGNYNIENLFLISRIVFEPSTKLPSLQLGRSDLAEDAVERFPLFPIALVNDIPFLLTGNFIQGGQRTSPLEYLRECETNCNIRKTELLPTRNPLKALDQFLDSEDWLSLEPKEEHFHSLRKQALRTIRNVYPADTQEKAESASGHNVQNEWHVHISNVEKLNPYWNRQMQDYIVIHDQP